MCSSPSGFWLCRLETGWVEAAGESEGKPRQCWLHRVGSCCPIRCFYSHCSVTFLRAEQSARRAGPGATASGEAASGSQFPLLFPENKNRCFSAAKDVKQWPQAWLQHVTQCDTWMWCQADTRPLLLPTQKEGGRGGREGKREGEKEEGRKEGWKEGGKGGRKKRRTKKDKQINGAIWIENVKVTVRKCLRYHTPLPWLILTCANSSQFLNPCMHTIRPTPHSS